MGAEKKATGYVLAMIDQDDESDGFLEVLTVQDASRSIRDYLDKNPKGIVRTYRLIAEHKGKQWGG